MRVLSTIQKREKLNTVMSVGDKGAGGAYHQYVVEINGPEDLLIHFQHGPRNEEGSRPGVIDSDLLEIVRDRLACFQEGEFATEYNAQALLHVETALMWLNRRVEDRIERQVLGTNNQ